MNLLCCYGNFIQYLPVDQIKLFLHSKDIDPVLLETKIIKNVCYHKFANYIFRFVSNDSVQVFRVPQYGDIFQEYDTKKYIQ